jgi:hypothetical protein
MYTKTPFLFKNNLKFPFMNDYQSVKIN